MVLLALSAGLTHAQVVELGTRDLSRTDAVHVAARGTEAFVVWNTLPTTSFTLFSARLQPDGGVALNTTPTLGNFATGAPRVTPSLVPGSWFVTWTDFSSNNVAGGGLLFEDGGSPQMSGGGFAIGATHPTLTRLTSTPTGYRVQMSTRVSTDVSVFGSTFVPHADVPRPEVGLPFDLACTSSQCVWVWVGDGGVGVMQESLDGGVRTFSTVFGTARSVSLARRNEEVFLAQEERLADGGSMVVWGVVGHLIQRRLDDGQQPAAACSAGTCWIAFVRRGSVFAVREDGSELGAVYDGLSPSVAVLSDGRAWVAGSVAVGNGFRPWVALVGSTLAVVDDAGAPAMDAGVDAGLDAGMGGLSDAGLRPDAGFPDAGLGPDAGFPDAGLGPDAGLPDAGAGPDAGLSGVDAGVEPDAGLLDAGGSADAGIPGTDAGVVDAGVVDAGEPQARSLLVGCGCGSVEAGPWALLLLLMAWVRRRA